MGMETGWEESGGMSGRKRGPAPSQACPHFELVIGECGQIHLVNDQETARKTIFAQSENGYGPAGNPIIERRHRSVSSGAVCR